MIHVMVMTLFNTVHVQHEASVRNQESERDDVHL